LIRARLGYLGNEFPVLFVGAFPDPCAMLNLRHGLRPTATDHVFVISEGNKPFLARWTVKDRIACSYR
jgi:hypothetical protein